LSMQGPLFVVHEPSGAAAIHALAAEWHEADIAIHLLSTQDMATPHPQTLEGVAARLVTLILSMQPDGPYRLAGWSQGSLLAYEIAIQLVGQDKAVEFVGLLGKWVRHGDHVPQPSPSIAVDLFVGIEEPAQISASADLLAWQTLLPSSQLRIVTLDAAQGSPQARHRALARAVAVAIAAGTGRACEMPELEYWPGLTIQTAQAGHSPLFCIPGAGDSVTGFAALAGALGRSWPVHGLQPRGMDGLLIPHSTVQAAADACLRTIDALQPHGPVHLLGHSFGGWVAYEIAGRLSAANRPPASLTLVDSEAPGQGGIVGGEHTSLGVIRQYIESLELVAERSLGIDPAALEAAGEAQRINMVHAGMVRVGLMPARSRPETLKGGVRTFATTLRTDYLPQRRYHGAVRLVIVAGSRTDGPRNDRENQTKILGWQHFAPQITYWKGPGNHMTILKPPHVAELVRWWLAGLQQTRERAQHLDHQSPGSGHRLSAGELR
jgi:arthrofactin-type cyclic lipopeptide synthetase C